MCIGRNHTFDAKSEFSESAASAGIGTDNEAIVKAVKEIADMGGVEAPLKGAQRDRKVVGDKFGVQGKDGKDPSIRDMAPDAAVQERLTRKIEKVIWEMMKNHSS